MDGAPIAPPTTIVAVLDGHIKALQTELAAALNAVDERTDELQRYGQLAVAQAGQIEGLTAELATARAELDAQRARLVNRLVDGSPIARVIGASRARRR